MDDGLPTIALGRRWDARPRKMHCAGLIINHCWDLKIMRHKFAIVVMAVLFAGCASPNWHTQEIVGQWEYYELSGDLGHCHIIWKFTADGKMEESGSVLEGKETMRDSGTYVITATNLIINLDTRSVSYMVENLNENILKLRDNDYIMEFKKKK